MVKPSQVQIDNITPEQIARCTKIYSYETCHNFYLVENEPGKLDDNGQILEYKVTYSRSMGFQCSCEAGKRGFVNCKNHYCKHVAWACAAAAEERAYEEAMEHKATEQKRMERAVVVTQLQSVGLATCSTLDCLQTANPATGKCVAHKPAREHLLMINGKEATDEEYARVMNAKPAKLVKSCYQPKAFSIL